MILFHQTDRSYPYLWESDMQPAMRWHALGDGPVHYFATTADGAWAEFLRHEEITDPHDLVGLRARAMWVVEALEEIPRTAIDLPSSTLTGGTDTWPACQRAAADLRNESGARVLRVPSAALNAPGAAVQYLDGGQKVEHVESDVVVLYGAQPSLRAHLAALGQPDPALLARVRHYSDT